MINQLKRSVCFLGALFFIFCSYAQSRNYVFPKNLSLSVQRSYGSFFTTAPKLSYIRDSYSSFTEISVSKQTDGSKDWHRFNNYPQAGLGLVYGNPGSKQYLGKVINLFPFLNFPFIRYKIFKSSLRVGTGISWVQKPYDIYGNHKNIIIGSHFNNFIHLSFENEIKLTRHLFLNGGLAFNHISNANIKLPNFGLNFTTVAVGLRYSFNEKIRKDSVTKLLNRKINFRFLASAGVKQTPWVGSPHYVVSLVGMELIKPVSSANNIGAGLTVFYDPSLTKDPSGYIKTNNKTENIQVGLHAFYERKVGRLSIPLQFGVYVLNPSKRSGVYQNVGVHYKFSRSLSAFYNLKVHAGKADYLHFGLGYTL